MPYKGPGFYNEEGVRVCSLHPESMQTFIDSQGFAHVKNSEDYEFLEDDVIEQARRDVKNGLYGDNLEWGGTN
jgi:hypothetical protein